MVTRACEFNVSFITSPALLLPQNVITSQALLLPQNVIASPALLLPQNVITSPALLLPQNVITSPALLLPQNVPAEAGTYDRCGDNRKVCTREGFVVVVTHERVRCVFVVHKQKRRVKLLAYKLSVFHLTIQVSAFIMTVKLFPSSNRTNIFRTVVGISTD